MAHRNANGRDPTWYEIAEASKMRGWFPQKIQKNLVVLERGRQKIIAKKLPSAKMWKVEYFSGKIMDDTTGADAEYFAKAIAVEMFMFK